MQMQITFENVETGQQFARTYQAGDWASVLETINSQPWIAMVGVDFL